MHNFVGINCLPTFVSESNSCMRKPVWRHLDSHHTANKHTSEIEIYVIIETIKHWNGFGEIARANMATHLLSPTPPRFQSIPYYLDSTNPPMDHLPMEKNVLQLIFDLWKNLLTRITGTCAVLFKCTQIGFNDAMLHFKLFMKIVACLLANCMCFGEFQIFLCCYYTPSR